MANLSEIVNRYNAGQNVLSNVSDAKVPYKNFKLFYFRTISLHVYSVMPHHGNWDLLDHFQEYSQNAAGRQPTLRSPQGC